MKALEGGFISDGFFLFAQDFSTLNLALETAERRILKRRRREGEER
jgi:hypothetical protein